MARKHRTVPRPPSRKRKASARPVPPRPKGKAQRMAVRRLSAMKYRLAGATYRVIAEKLTEERAQVYADANGISIDRAMKKIKYVSTRTAWDDVLAEFEGLRRETEITRGDAMAMENTRIDQLYSKALALYSKGSVPAGWHSRSWGAGPSSMAWTRPRRSRPRIPPGSTRPTPQRLTSTR